MAGSKSAKGKGKKSSEKPSAAKLAKMASAEKHANYLRLFALRQARDDARAQILQAEFRLNRALNIQHLAGTDQDDEIAEARAALNALREEASRTSQLFEVEKFAARKTPHW